MRSSIAATPRSRKVSSHSLSGASAKSSPYSAASDGPDRLQIVARVEAFGDLADVLAERLAVAQVHRAGERIDLRAGVVDIIFLGDAEAGRLEQPRQAIADDRAAAMAHVHRPGRVGRDIFDVDPLVGADVDRPYSSPSARMVASSSRQASGASRRLMKPGPGDLDRCDSAVAPPASA